MTETDIKNGEDPIDFGIDFNGLLAGVKNYKELQEALTKKMKELRERGLPIGFVSGPVGPYTPGLTDDERERAIWSSMKILDQYAQQLQKESRFPVFSCKDVFSGDVWNKLEETKLPHEERSVRIKDMFDGILRGGVTHVFMAPGWNLPEAPGSRAEHATALELGLRVRELPFLPGRQK